MMTWEVSDARPGVRSTLGGAVSVSSSSWQIAVTRADSVKGDVLSIISVKVGTGAAEKSSDQLLTGS